MLHFLDESRCHQFTNFSSCLQLINKMIQSDKANKAIKNRLLIFSKITENRIQLILVLYFMEEQNNKHTVF